MSDTTIQLRTARALSLGDAMPLHRTPAELEKKQAAGGKTVVQIDKTITEMLAERRDAAELTTRCAVDGCTWSHFGTAKDCRDRAAEHRARAHPELAARRGPKRGMSSWNRGPRDEEDRAAAMAEVERRKRTTHAETPLLEEVDAAERLGPDGPPASSSSPLDTPAEISLGPNDTATTDERTVSSTAATAEPSPVEISAGTTNRREPMPRPYTRWSRDLMIERVREVADELGHTPTVAELRKRKLSSLVDTSQLAKHGFTGYPSLVDAAGLEPVETGVPAPPQPPARVEPDPDAAVTLREPARNADIPYDADVLEREAAFLRRRADAFDTIAKGVRELAEIDEERAA